MTRLPDFFNMYRMEVIELSGYIAEEKVAIAERYLVPQAREAAGIGEDRVLVDQTALNRLIHSYCRESGVRNLKKHIEKLFRKAALKLVRGDDKVSLGLVSCFIVDRLG